MSMIITLQHFIHKVNIPEVITGSTLILHLNINSAEQKNLRDCKSVIKSDPTDKLDNAKFTKIFI